MECSYCHNEIQGNSTVEENGLAFCNPLHRYHFREANGRSTTTTPMPINSNTLHRSEADTQTQNAVPNSLHKIRSAVGMLIGIAASSYFGMAGLLPLLLTLFFIWLLRKQTSLSVSRRAGMAIIGAHLLWMVIGAVIVGAWTAVYIDLLVMSIILVWLYRNNGIAPVLTLIVYQCVSLYINISGLIAMELHSFLFKSLSVAIILRLSSTVVICISYVQYRNAAQRLHVQYPAGNPAAAAK